MRRHSCFTVQGKPFFSLGGQTHNSSSYVLADMPYAFESVRKLGGNTVATPICWHTFEPAEGRFNPKYVTDLIDLAREEEMHLVFLWFGSWKNGNMEYTPNWVKCDRRRFQRTTCKDGTELGVLSAHCPENFEADRKAFVELMKVLKAHDGGTQTVIAVQVENEAGIIGPTARDFSPFGQASFAKKVPQLLLDYAKAHPQGKLYEFWKAAGGKRGGTWTQVFGRFGAEACEAYALSNYINGIAAAGKEVYDLFLYANVWLDGLSHPQTWNNPGINYPSGEAVTRTLDIWYAVADSLDAISPDNYQAIQSRHREVTDTYANKDKGWPLYVPESHAAALNASEIFYAVVDKEAIGYHIFATESTLDPETREVRPAAAPMKRSMHMLTAAWPVLQPAIAGRKAMTILQQLGENASLRHFDGWEVLVNYNGPGFAWAGATDYHHRGKEEFREGKGTHDPREEKGRGVLMLGEDGWYYLVGHLIRLFFERPSVDDGSYRISLLSPEHQSSDMSVLDLTEGHFDEDGNYVVDRVRDGDERHGIWAMWDCGVIRFKMEG